MPHTPKPPDGTRFFARIDKFHCECPACGAMIVAHKDGTLSSEHLALKRRRATQYNPIASQLTCPTCRRTFGVGLLLWPMKVGRRRADLPADHQPTLRELRELAGLAYGVWATEIKRQGDALNIAVDAECICVDGWRGDCPIHPQLFCRRAKEEGETARAELAAEEQEQAAEEQEQAAEGEPPEDEG